MLYAQWSRYGRATARLGRKRWPCSVVSASLHPSTISTTMYILNLPTSHLQSAGRSHALRATQLPRRSPLLLHSPHSPLPFSLPLPLSYTHTITCWGKPLARTTVLVQYAHACVPQTSSRRDFHQKSSPPDRPLETLRRRTSFPLPLEALGAPSFRPRGARPL